MKPIQKPYIFKKTRFLDNRGYFQEIFLEKELKKKIKFTATAYSKKNVIRGLHFQLKKKQTKIITVMSGKILDVVVNLKKGSRNFGKIYYFLLNEGDSVYIPNCFAHGYECLSNNASIIYHLDNYRDAKNESGIPYNDKKLKIKWKTKKPILSLRDKNHFSFLEFKKKYKGL
jgi:dTDP-4-dehydrorhamnose 3,5-epimerase